MNFFNTELLIHYDLTFRKIYQRIKNFPTEI